MRPFRVLNIQYSSRGISFLVSLKFSVSAVYHFRGYQLSYTSKTECHFPTSIFFHESSLQISLSEAGELIELFYLKNLFNFEELVAKSHLIIGIIHRV